MQVRYDHEADVIYITTETAAVTAASLLDDPDIAVELATKDGHHIVGLIAMWASAYLPLGKRGYDPESDILLMGKRASDPKLITENGDIIGYWQVYEADPDGFRDPIGVAIKSASVHLAKVNTAPDNAYLVAQDASSA